MKKCFGLISWLPEKEPARKERESRINRLFAQLNNLWPDIDILIITQNWKNFKPVEIKNKIIRKDFKEGLGILKARQTLRTEFLKTDYEYIIMFDDDAIIRYFDDKAPSEFMKTVDKHPDGFCFIHRPDYEDLEKTKTCAETYAPAQLNLCAISRKIYEQEPIPNVDPQKNEAYEDHTFAVLLHNKYPEAEFYPPKTIRCIQFQNRHETAPSTWACKGGIKQNKIAANDSAICAFIRTHKDLPRLDLYFEYGILVSKKAKQSYIDNEIEKVKEKQKRDSVYLYF